MGKYRMDNTKIDLSCHNRTRTTTGGKEQDRHETNIGILFSDFKL
jgi:hypothetical protein